MSDSLWTRVYHGPGVGWIQQGECAACSFQSVPLAFVIWQRGLRLKTLCGQCSHDVRETMLHEGWLMTAEVAR